jgi:hypothetical protein
MDAERIWREKSDEELVEAGGRLSEFTAEGERIIRAELHRRGLPDDEETMPALRVDES